jgi:hypothetical protein
MRARRAAASAKTRASQSSGNVFVCFALTSHNHSLRMFESVRKQPKTHLNIPHDKAMLLWVTGNRNTNTDAGNT